MTATARAPREHGFWVMMVLALAAGLLLQPSWVGLATALGIALALVAGAVVIGRRIRKNPALQLASTVLLGLVPAPIALVGGAEMGQTLLVAVGLAAAFTAGGLLVVSVLQRARKRFSTAAWTRWSACLLSAAATIWYLAGGHPYKAAAGQYRSAERWRPRVRGGQSLRRRSVHLRGPHSERRAPDAMIGDEAAHHWEQSGQLDRK